MHENSDVLGSRQFSSSQIEELRLAALHKSQLLDSPPEAAYDCVTDLIRRLLNVPVALVSLVDKNRQFFKSSQGLPEPWASRRETPLTHSFCQYVVSSNAPLIVQDARRHPLVCDNLAVSELNVAAYIGVPLETDAGITLGSLAAIDIKPRKWSDDNLQILKSLSAIVLSEIRLRHQWHERMEIMAAKRSQEILNHGLLENSGDCIKILDVAGRILSINTPGLRLMEIDDPKSVIGHLWSEFLPEAAKRSVINGVEIARKGGSSRFQEFSPTAKGLPKWWDVIISGLTNANGEVTRLLSVSRDVTEISQGEIELKRSRDEAIAASRSKDDFLAALSHELRTPLNPILLIASEAASNQQLPPEVREDFDIIRRNTELEAVLIDDLLDVTTITNGKLHLEKHTVDAHVVLRDAIAVINPGIVEKQIQLKIDLLDQSLWVLGDAIRLQQIFWNVLKNAVKFTPENGQINVQTSISTDQSQMICKISDSGIGLTVGEIEKIFKAFSQGDHAKNDSSYRFGGLGLGLAISTKLVELHNGSIEARSSGRNQGATFIITLPLTEVLSRPVAPFEQNSQPALPGSSKSIDVYRILLVEDHENTRNTLAQLLERRGYEVTCAQNVASARRMASEREHNVIISDIGLPDGNGYELITELHEQYGLMAIALTGYGMETDVARSEASGFILHLTKPVRIQTLETALAKIRAIK